MTKDELKSLKLRVGVTLAFMGTGCFVTAMLIVFFPWQGVLCAFIPQLFALYFFEPAKIFETLDDAWAVKRCMEVLDEDEECL